MKKAEEQQQTTLQIAHTMIESKIKNTSATQLKILILIASKMQIEHEIESKEIDLNRFYGVTFSAVEIKKELNLNKFTDVLSSIKTLQHQEISYKIKDNEGTWTSLENFIARTDFIEDRKIRISISGAILQFLTYLTKNGYTKIIKEIVLSLNSKYSIKLLELTSKIQQQDTKKREYEIKEMSEMLDFNIEQVRGVSKLKKKFEEARAELDSKSKLSFEYKFICKKWTGKSGKPSYTHIEITPRQNEVQPSLF